MPGTCRQPEGQQGRGCPPARLVPAIAHGAARTGSDRRCCLHCRQGGWRLRTPARPRRREKPIPALRRPAVDSGRGDRRCVRGRRRVAEVRPACVRLLCRSALVRCCSAMLPGLGAAAPSPYCHAEPSRLACPCDESAPPLWGRAGRRLRVRGVLAQLQSEARRARWPLARHQG